MGFSFQIEMNYRALQAGVKVVEVPIHFSDRYSGSSKITLGIQAEGLWVPFALKFASKPQRRSIT
jgi:dolichol-phosphate mannosyltransferase